MKVLSIDAIHRHHVCALRVKKSGQIQILLHKCASNPRVQRLCTAVYSVKRRYQSPCDTLPGHTVTHIGDKPTLLLRVLSSCCQHFRGATMRTDNYFSQRERV